MQGADVVGIVAEDGRFQVRCADHVVRYHQHFVMLRPAVVPGDHRRQFGDRARLRVMLSLLLQHGHKMALAAAKAAV